jgi:hypothetical protein
MVDANISSLKAKASPSELKQIKMFKIRATKLFNNRLVINRFTPSADLHIDSEYGPSFSFQLQMKKALIRF